MQSTSRKSGFVAVLGRPSAGKSSLVNAICGQKISIVSSVPQTTRNSIRGIFTDPRGQIIFLDTPGWHLAEKKVNLRMRTVVTESLQEADAILYTVDTTRPAGEEERAIAAMVATLTVPRVIVPTKCDRAESAPEQTLQTLAELGLAQLPSYAVGGLGEEPDTPTGIDHLLQGLFDLLPEGDPWYPEDHYTDQEPSFRIAEIVREQAILRARQELPHALYVEVADLEQRGKTLWARVFLIVEKESQQGILVGKKGSTVTAIRKDAERVLAGLFPGTVRLSLQVKTRSGWRRNEALLKKLIR